MYIIINKVQYVCSHSTVIAHRTLCDVGQKHFVGYGASVSSPVTADSGYIKRYLKNITLLRLLSYVIFIVIMFQLHCRCWKSKFVSNSQYNVGSCPTTTFALFKTTFPVMHSFINSKIKDATMT